MVTSLPPSLSLLLSLYLGSSSNPWVLSYYLACDAAAWKMLGLPRGKGSSRVVVVCMYIYVRAEGAVLRLYVLENDADGGALYVCPV